MIILHQPPSIVSSLFQVLQDNNIFPNHNKICCNVPKYYAIDQNTHIFGCWIYDYQDCEASYAYDDEIACNIKVTRSIILYFPLFSPEDNQLLLLQWNYNPNLADIFAQCHDLNLPISPNL